MGTWQLALAAAFAATTTAVAGGAQIAEQCKHEEDASAMLQRGPAGNWDSNLAASSLNGVAQERAPLRHMSLRDTDPMAVCTDGTSSGYYWRPATTNASLWVVGLLWGNWCFDQESCDKRCYNNSGSYLCSSSAWPEEYGTEAGIFKASEDWLGGANTVVIGYCTSDAYMGDAQAFGYQFRGARVLRAVFQDLVKKHGLGMGQHKDVVVLAGHSAGARGAMVHLDFVQDMISDAGGNSVDVVGMLDSPLWLDVPNAEGNSKTGLTEQCELIFSYANISNVGEECERSHAGDDLWKCVMGQYRIPHLQTPYFLIASQYDRFQLHMRLGKQAETHSDLAYAADLANKTKALVEQLYGECAASAEGDGDCARHAAIMSSACFDHASAPSDRGWYQQTVQETSAADAFAAFMGMPVAEPSHRDTAGQHMLWVDECDGFACGPGCVSG